MALLRTYLKRDVPLMNEHNVRLRYIGRIHELPPAVQERMAWAQEQTAKNTGMIMTLALNYGGRAELIDAFQRIVQAAASNGGLAGLKDRRRDGFAPPVRLRPARSRPGDPHQRRDAALQLSAVAAGLLGDLRDPDAVAGLRRRASAGGAGGLPEARAALRQRGRRFRSASPSCTQG